MGKPGRRMPNQARTAELADRIIELRPGPDETVTDRDDTTSALSEAVASIVAAIPARRWTTYTEVALVASSHTGPVGMVLAGRPMTNAWREPRSGHARLLHLRHRRAIPGGAYLLADRVAVLVRPAVVSRGRALADGDGGTLGAVVGGGRLAQHDQIRADVEDQGARFDGQRFESSGFELGGVIPVVAWWAMILVHGALLSAGPAT